MSLHIQLTVMILFINIGLSLMAPAALSGPNFMFETSDDGKEVKLNQQLKDAFKDSNPDDKVSEDTGFFDGAAQIFSGIGLVFVFIGLLFQIFFASFFLIGIVPGPVALILIIPLILMYGLAIIGFIRGA